MTPSDYITLREPALAAAQSARVPGFVTLATLQTSAKVFGANYNYAIALRALHLLVMSARGGAGGAITSEREGTLARSYASPMPGASDLSSTGYGEELLTLARAGGAGLPLNHAVRS